MKHLKKTDSVGSSSRSLLPAAGLSMGMRAAAVGGPGTPGRRMSMSTSGPEAVMNSACSRASCDCSTFSGVPEPTTSRRYNTSVRRHGNDIVTDMSADACVVSDAACSRAVANLHAWRTCSHTTSKLSSRRWPTWKPVLFLIIGYINTRGQWYFSVRSSMHATARYRAGLRGALWF